MRFLLAVLLLAQSVFTYPPGRSAVSTYPQQPAGEVCTEVNVPFVNGAAGAVVGYEYDFPILPFFSPNPPDSRNPTGIGAGPDFVQGNAYVLDGAISNNTQIKPWVITDQGFQQLVIWANNCFGIGLNGAAVTGVIVESTGWVAGEPRLLTTLSGLVTTPAAPPNDAATVNFADFILWQEGTTSVVVIDGNTSTVVYTGPFGPSMVDNTTYTCAYQALWGTNVTFTIEATNATGTMSISTLMQIQDPLGACGGPA